MGEWLPFLESLRVYHNFARLDTDMDGIIFIVSDLDPDYIQNLTIDIGRFYRWKQSLIVNFRLTISQCNGIRYSPVQLYDYASVALNIMFQWLGRVSSASFD